MVKKMVNPKFAKTREYGRVIRKIEKAAKCPFCKENFKYHKEPILKKKGNWFITKESWPYKNTEYHFLIIPEEHKEKFSDLDYSDFDLVSKLVNWVTKRYKIKGGCLTLRFGDSTYTGATVRHLHFHLIVPKMDKRKKEAKTVYFPIG